MCYLTLLRVGWLQMSVEDLLHHIGKQAGDDDDDDGEPGRAAGQQLHEDEVHVLCVEEGPGGGQKKHRARRLTTCTADAKLKPRLKTMTSLLTTHTQASTVQTAFP